MIIDIAKRFAAALDAEDYISSEKILAEDCMYYCRGEVFQGPSAIIESYRGNGNTANTSFDHVEYESAVSADTANSATIHFIDHLRRHHQTFTFRCEQLIEINDSDLIVRIEHVDLPGQREALADFKRQSEIE